VTGEENTMGKQPHNSSGREDKGAAGNDQHAREREEEQRLLRDRLAHIKHKIVVLSGKGGVGKSTVAVNLAMSLSLAGRRVGLLDIDLHGPSVPRLLNLGREAIEVLDGAIRPARVDGLKVMSMGFLLHSDEQAVIWRGPLKAGVIKQFLKDVEWGSLDYLVVDCPPGTGDEPLSIAQLLAEATPGSQGDMNAVIVTTPQELSLLDVRKSINFCRQLDLPVVGVIENMSGFVCPSCGAATAVFGAGGGERMATTMGVPFLGRIPLDPRLVQAGDDGEVFVQRYARSETAKAFGRAIRPILDAGQTEAAAARPPESTREEDGNMRIAIPMAEGHLAMHFGHCEEFALIDVDLEKKQITGVETVQAPDHEPGLLPVWLQQRGANLIIAGGMGSRAQSLFAQHQIDVVVGAPSEEPDAVVRAYLDGSLQAGDNICDH